jgi:hypothetical protein
MNVAVEGVGRCGCRGFGVAMYPVRSWDLASTAQLVGSTRGLRVHGGAVRVSSEGGVDNSGRRAHVTSGGHQISWQAIRNHCGAVLPCLGAKVSATSTGSPGTPETCLRHQDNGCRWPVRMSPPSSPALGLIGRAGDGISPSRRPSTIPRARSVSVVEGHILTGVSSRNRTVRSSVDAGARRRPARLWRTSQLYSSAETRSRLSSDPRSVTRRMNRSGACRMVAGLFAELRQAGPVGHLAAVQRRSGPHNSDWAEWRSVQPRPGLARSVGAALSDIRPRWIQVES